MRPPHQGFALSSTILGLADGTLCSLTPLGRPRLSSTAISTSTSPLVWRTAPQSLLGPFGRLPATSTAISTLTTPGRNGTLPSCRISRCVESPDRLRNVLSFLCRLTRRAFCPLGAGSLGGGISFFGAGSLGGATSADNSLDAKFSGQGATPQGPPSTQVTFAGREAPRRGPPSTWAAFSTPATSNRTSVQGP